MNEEHPPNRGGLVRRTLRRVRDAARGDERSGTLMERLDEARSIFDLASLKRIDTQTALAVLDTGVDRIAEALLEQDAAARDLARLVASAGGLQRPDVFMAVLRYSPFLDGSLPHLMEPALRGGTLRLDDALREQCRETLARLAAELVQLRDETCGPPPAGDGLLPWLHDTLDIDEAIGLLALLEDDAAPSEALDRTLLFSYGLFLQATLLRHAAGLVRTLLLPPTPDP